MVGQIEQRDECAAAHTLGQGSRRGAVHRDAGRCEVFVQQPGVGIAPGVQDGHCVEGHPTAGRIDDGAHDHPHLLVGVGATHHPHRRRSVADARSCRNERGGGDGDSESRDRGGHGSVGRADAGDADDRGTGNNRVDGNGESRHRGRYRLGQVPDDGPESGGQARVASHRVCGGGGEIGLDVPLGVEPRPHGPVDAHDIGRSAPLRGEPFELARAELAQLPMRGNQSPLGGGVFT